MENALTFSHSLMKKYLQEGDTALDATVGNGHDTVFLAQLVGPQGQLYGFDIQQRAIENTQKKLQEENLADRVDLFHAGHENLDHYLPADLSLQAAIFNLGYLPQADKSIITQGPTTIQALSLILERLAVHGLVVLVVYYGHEGGREEKELLEAFLRQLDQKVFQVLKYQFINQKNQPPFVLAIEKIK